jgi:hypothetical protein
MTADHRQTAHQRVEQLIALLGSEKSASQVQPLVDECEALKRAIVAFHMEGIRFRMYNVDRLLRGGLPVPPDAAGIFADVRHELEAAGFHTRSHQAPPSGSA